MVIPNVPLPIAGDVTPSQPGGSSVAGKGEGSIASSGEAGGLFAALLAALDGSGAETVAAFVENGATVAVDGSRPENAGLGALLTDAATSDEVPKAAGIPAELATTSEENAAPNAVPQRNSGAVVIGQTKVVAEALSVAVTPQSASTAVTQLPANIDPSAQIGRSANVRELAVAPTPVPVDADATPDIKPEATPKPASQVALLTGVKGPVLTVPAAPVDQVPGLEQATQVAQLAAPRALESAIRVPAQGSDGSVAIAKSEPDSPVLIDFEKAKQSLSVLRTSEESSSTPMRKAIEAFAKPVMGRSEAVATAPRPQATVFVPLTAGDSANAPLADVTRVAPTIAPAELGADAPRPVAVPEAPERPVRTTLSDVAQTAVRSIRYLARNGEHKMTVRLIPESLGEIRIEVLSTKEALTVKIVSESVVVREAMEAQAHQLRETLSQEGLEVKSITVSDDSGSGRGSYFQRDAHASRNGERGQSQTGQESTPDQSSGGNSERAIPRARHEGAFDRVA